jgi:uncharacterized protein YdhG (YjbR/CyaY superfamily)
MTASPDVDAYIARFDGDVHARLGRLRDIVRAAAPTAVEAMSYGMPGYKLNGKPLVYFAAFAKHIGLYATPTGHDAFRDELASYKHGKGSVQFPLNQPMPWELIERIVLFRVDELG